MAQKIKLVLTEIEMDAILEIISTCEGMIGTSEEAHGLLNWDTEMEKHIKKFDKMLKKNGYSR